MWINNRDHHEIIREPAAELGAVTVAGAETGVALAGERRQVPLCAPGGYHWRPGAGDTLLVIKCGPEEAPCAAGRLDESAGELEPGEIFLSAAPGTGIRLRPDGSVLLTGDFQLSGTLSVAGGLAVEGPVTLSGLVTANGAVLSQPEAAEEDV